MLNVIYLPISAIFPQESGKTLEDILAGVDSRMLMKFCTVFSPYGHQMLDRKGISEFFLKWFSLPNHPLATELVIPQAWIFFERVGRNISIINTEAILRLFEFTLGYTGKRIDFSDQELELKILKGLLIT